MTEPAPETCKHSWGNYDEYPDGLVETSCHLCGFTRRGRFVDNLRDSADLEADGLRGRLALAIKALEGAEHAFRLMWQPDDDWDEADTEWSTNWRNACRAALNQLSKSASNPQENHGT